MFCGFEAVVPQKEIPGSTASITASNRPGLLRKLLGAERKPYASRFRRVDRFLDHYKKVLTIFYPTTLKLFLDALRTRVGSPIVLSNIAHDLQVSPVTLKHYLEVLERMYVIFVIRPFSKNLSRALQKSPKVYFFDTADVIGDDGAKFENLVATQILKRLQFSEDYQGYRYQLHYIRDKEGHEVDFAIVRDHVLQDLIEVKWADADISTSLTYFSRRLLPARARQIVCHLKRPYSRGQLQVQDVRQAFSAPYWNA